MAWSPEMIYTHGVGGKDDFSRWPIGSGINYTKVIRGNNIGPRLTARATTNNVVNGYNGNKWAIGPDRGSTALGHPNRQWTKIGSGHGPASITFPVANNYPPSTDGGEVGNIVMDTGQIQNVFKPTRDASGGNRTYRLHYNGVNISGRLHSVQRGVRVGTSATLGTPIQGGLMAHELDTAGFFIAHAFHWSPQRRGNAEDPQLDRHIQSKGFQYPACGVDAGANLANQNTGPVPYGALLAIRPQDIQTVVNLIKAAGNTTNQAREVAIRMAIAHCLYGVFINDGGAGWRGDKASVHGQTFTTNLRNIFQNANLAWWSWFYYCENAVIGADAMVQPNGALTGSIGTPTGSATVPHGGGSPISCVVDGVTYTGYNGAWDAGTTTTPPPPPPPSEAAMPTGLISAAFGLEEIA